MVVSPMAVIDSNSDKNRNYHEEEAIITQLPKSAREIYRLLQDNGALKPRQIGLYTTLSNRTIRYGLKILCDGKLVRRIPDLQDLRTHFYAIN